MAQFDFDADAGTPAVGSVLAMLAGRTAITRADVAMLRQAHASAPAMDRADLEAILAIERRASRKCREWGDTLIESVLDYVVWGERPTGVLTDETAHWLLGQVGAAPTPACLALLVAVIEEAVAVPPGFPEAVRDRAKRMFGDRGALVSAAA